jgi:hypothetical protein
MVSKIHPTRMPSHPFTGEELEDRVYFTPSFSPAPILKFPVI